MLHSIMTLFIATVADSERPPKDGAVVVPRPVLMFTPTPPPKPMPLRMLGPVVVTPTPTPTATPTAAPIPVRPPTITFSAGVGGGAYGLFESGDSIFVTGGINAYPYLPFPIFNGHLIENLRVRVEDEQARSIDPVREQKVKPASDVTTEIGVAWEATPISAWGYDLQKPGRYRDRSLLRRLQPIGPAHTVT